MSSRPQQSADIESEYLFNNTVHIKFFVFAALAVSCICSLLTVAFLPGSFKWIGLIIPPIIHLLLAFAVHHRHIIGLYASFGLIATIYVLGLFSIIIFLTMEIVENRRGSFKLYILHLATLSGLWTNILLVLMYGLSKLIKVSRNNYNTFVNEEEA